MFEQPVDSKKGQILYTTKQKRESKNIIQLSLSRKMKCLERIPRYWPPLNIPTENLWSTLKNTVVIVAVKKNKIPIFYQRMTTSVFFYFFLSKSRTCDYLSLEQLRSHGLTDGLLHSRWSRHDTIVWKCYLRPPHLWTTDDSVREYRTIGRTTRQSVNSN